MAFQKSGVSSSYAPSDCGKSVSDSLLRTFLLFLKLQIPEMGIDITPHQ